MTVYSSERRIQCNELLNYNFLMLITSIKLINLEKHFTTRFYR